MLFVYNMDSEIVYEKCCEYGYPLCSDDVSDDIVMVYRYRKNVHGDISDSYNYVWVKTILCSVCEPFYEKSKCVNCNVRPVWYRNDASCAVMDKKNNRKLKVDSRKITALRKKVKDMRKVDEVTLYEGSEVIKNEEEDEEENEVMTNGKGDSSYLDSVLNGIKKKDDIVVENNVINGTFLKNRYCMECVGVISKIYNIKLKDIHNGIIPMIHKNNLDVCKAKYHRYLNSTLCMLAISVMVGMRYVKR